MSFNTLSPEVNFAPKFTNFQYMYSLFHTAVGPGGRPGGPGGPGGRPGGPGGMNMNPQQMARLMRGRVKLIRDYNYFFIQQFIHLGSLTLCMLIDHSFWFDTLNLG